MKNKNTKWTLKDIEFLKKDYPIYGAIPLQSKLQRSSHSISEKARKLNIKYIPNLPVDNKYMEEFKNIVKPEIAYFLGFWWADAYISDNNHYIIFSIAEKDGKDIKEKLLDIYPFNYSIYRPKTRPNSQKTMVFRKGDKNLHKILVENDYHMKSSVPPSKILSKIPKHLHNFWWQGFFDGDGCLYLNKGSHPRISISATINQDWGFYRDLCVELGINFRISKTTNKLGSWSKIYIQNIKECRLFLDYIYKDKVIGLERKYNKYVILKETVQIPEEKKSKFIGVSYKKDRKNPWRSYLGMNNQIKSLGHFKTEIEAAKARDGFIISNGLEDQYELNNF